MKQIDIGKDFSDILTNRDENQRDGTKNGVEFRKMYLDELDNKEKWGDFSQEIILNFANVKRMGPSWANEVFAYFTKYGEPEIILKKIKLDNITRVKKTIIEKEIETGYNRV